MIILNEVLNNETIDTVCRYLLNGYAILVKTDTQWGLMSINPNILYDIKKRPLDKKIVRLVGPNYKFAKLNELQKMFIKQFWPGPVTIVLDGEAFRLTNKKFINAIIIRLGLMVYCTSANISGSEPINSIEEALVVFSNDIDKIVMIAPIKENINENNELSTILPPMPSTIVDIDYWYIIRKGVQYLDVVNYIANVIIPYYEKNKAEYDNLINKYETIEVNKIIDYEGVPIIDLVYQLTPKVRKYRQKQFENKTKNKK